MKVSRSKKIKYLIVFLFILASLGKVFRVEPVEQSRLVAIVEDEPIGYEDISVERDVQRQIFRTKYNREPSFEELSGIIAQVEQSKLIGKITTILKKRALRRFGITVTMEEARVEFKNRYPGLKEDAKGVLKKERFFYQQLSLALKEVQKYPQKEKEIFEAMLKDIMGYETWQASVEYFNTAEKIGWIEKNIPETTDDIYKSGELSMRDWLLEEKLREKITEDIEVKDEEIKMFFESKHYGKVTGLVFEEMKPQLREELLEIKRRDREQEWWQEQYKKARIEIKDERFKDVLEMLIPSAGKELKKEIKP